MPLNNYNPFLSPEVSELWQAHNRVRGWSAKEAMPQHDEKNIYLYGMIAPANKMNEMMGSPTISAMDIIGALKHVRGNFTLHIHSPGGDIFEGAAVMAALNEYDGDMTIKIEGMCASMASAIAAMNPAHKVLMAEMAHLMIHKPVASAIMMNAHQMTELAGALKKIEANMLMLYERRGNMSAAQLASAISKGNFYMTAEEALANGFVDKIMGAGQTESEDEKPEAADEDEKPDDDAPSDDDEKQEAAEGDDEKPEAADEDEKPDEAAPPDDDEKKARAEGDDLDPEAADDPDEKNPKAGRIDENGEPISADKEKIESLAAALDNARNFSLGSDDVASVIAMQTQAINTQTSRGLIK